MRGLIPREVRLMSSLPNPNATPVPADVAAALLQERYGDEVPAAGLVNAAIAQLLTHKSIRAFADRPVPEGLVETLVAAAQSAASSSNLQVWSVVAVEKPETKARLAAIAGGQKHVAEAPLMLVWLADLSRLRALGRAAGVPTDGLDYFETFLVGVIDAALAAQNALAAAESLGLGGVYIGALRNKPEEVAELLGLPPEAMAVFGMCIGYPDPARPADVKPRLPQSVVLHRERYDPSLPEAPLAAYEEAMKAFQAKQSMGVVGWQGTALQRVKGPESLSGRDRMMAAVRALGFALR